MGVRYIGSKARVADAILDLAATPYSGRFIDAFCGTGAVASAAASRGWRVTLNDALQSAVSMSIGATVGVGNVPFESFGATRRQSRSWMKFLANRASFMLSTVQRQRFTEELSGATLRNRMPHAWTQCERRFRAGLTMVG